MESFPAQFCREIRSYWQRKRYRRLPDGQPAHGRRPANKAVTLGDGERGARRRRRYWRLKKTTRLRMMRKLSPAWMLARLRDAYVDFMLWLAAKAGTSMAVSAQPEAWWSRRIPRSRSGKLKAAPLSEFEQRLVAEICRSIAAVDLLSSSANSDHIDRRSTPLGEICRSIAAGDLLSSSSANSDDIDRRSSSTLPSSAAVLID